MGNASVSMSSAFAVRPSDHAAYVGAIPKHYHYGVGPVLFDPYARELAARVAARAPRRVLETACGTGILTRRLRELLSRDAKVVATDLNEPMLAVARRIVGAELDVDWSQADMTQLDAPTGSFDVVVCQFGLMFVADKCAAVREALRVLKPGGLLLLATWRSLAHNPAIHLADETVSSLLPGERPGFYLTQTALGEPAQLEQLLSSAGFTQIESAPVAKTAVPANVRSVAAGLIRGFPIIDEIEARAPALAELATDMLARALDRQLDPLSFGIASEALVSSALAPS